jgi:hypothetical protein
MHPANHTYGIYPAMVVTDAEQVATVTVVIGPTPWSKQS